MTNQPIVETLSEYLYPIVETNQPILCWLSEVKISMILNLDWEFGGILGRFAIVQSLEHFDLLVFLMAFMTCVDGMTGTCIFTDG